MTLHAQQQDALDQVKAWIGQGCPGDCFRLFGYAGTGKSTIAKLFPTITAGRVLYAAYTGKAAHVLNKKGCDATTIHRLIYRPRQNSGRHLRKLEDALDAAQKAKDGKTVRKLEHLIHLEKEKLKSPAWDRNDESDLKEASLLVLDEVSMVGDRLARDLISYGTPILALGDPAQLPPVGGSGGFFTDHKPNVMLTDIHRQVEGSEVLDLATRVRACKPLPLGPSVVPKGSLSLDDIVQYDQILVGKNKTRQTINHRVRKHLGYEGLPKPGEKLVCLRNNHDLGIMNGSQWYIRDCTEVEGDKIIMHLIDDDHNKVDVVSWTHLFEGKDAPFHGATDCELFDYGYAMTVHKSQGSQWDKVFIVNESDVFRKNRFRWLYTAITRASEKVMISQ